MTEKISEFLRAHGDRLTVGEIAEFMRMPEQAVNGAITALADEHCLPEGTDNSVAASIREKAGSGDPAYTLGEICAILETGIKIMTESLSQAYARYGKTYPRTAAV